MTVAFEPTVEDPTPIKHAQTGALERELDAHGREDWDRRWYGPARFSYHMVRSYPEAVAALIEYGEGSKSSPAARAWCR